MNERRHRRLSVMEVTRDSKVIGTSPGNSFFDDTRTEGANHVYTLAAIDVLGSRSEPATIAVP